MVVSYLQNHEDAEEVIQDTIISALNGLSNYRSEASLQTWVYRIAVNKCRDCLRKRSTLKFSYKDTTSLLDNDNMMRFEPVEFEHPGVLLESKEQMQLLFDGINKLPPQQKEAIILMKFDHKSQKEAAETMGISTKAVESLISRGKQNLKHYFEENGLDYYNAMIKK